MLERFSHWLTYTFLNLPENMLGHAVNFFIYDTIKIFFILFLVSFSIGVLRSFFPPEKIKEILTHKTKYLGNVIAALLGIITPFCSCSAITFFFGFLEAGVPLGTTFSFLVSAPMVNEIALFMLWGIFGFKIAFIYILSGVTIAIISGIIIQKLKLEHLVKDFTNPNVNAKITKNKMNIKERTIYGINNTKYMTSQVWLYVIIGIALGAVMHGYIPNDLLIKYGQGHWYAVPFVVLIGIPLYSNAAGMIPLISVLVEKGVGMGTALSFMMAVTSLSLPEFMILRKAMKPKLLLIFGSIVGCGIIFTGYLFNFILK